MGATLPPILTALGGSLFNASTPTAYQAIRANGGATAYELVTIYSRSEADSTFATIGSVTAKASLAGGNTWYGLQNFLDGSDVNRASIDSSTGVITGVGTGLSGVLHLTGTQSVAGAKTFTGDCVFTNATNPVMIVRGTGGGPSRLVVDSQSSSSASLGFREANSAKWSFGSVSGGFYIYNEVGGNYALQSTGSGSRWLFNGATDDGSNKVQINGSASIFGSNPIRFKANSSTSTNREQANFTPSFVVSTDASRTSRLVCNVFDTAEREAWRAEASGSAPMLGFYGSSAVAKQTVTGSRGSNAALADLLTKLATLGLITDSTS